MTNTIYYNCGNTLVRESMTTSSVRINSELVEQARLEAKGEMRTVQAQLEFWIKVGKAALDNPDLPASFVAEAVLSLEEPRELATKFTPRSSQ
jgi:hypothetical protein